MFLVNFVSKYFVKEKLCLLSKGCKGVSVMVFDYLCPLALGHSLQSPPKVLEDKFGFVGGIVVAVEPLKLSCITRISSRSWIASSLGALSLNIGSSSLQTLPSASEHDTFIVLQSTTPFCTTKLIGTSLIVLAIVLRVSPCDCNSLAVSCAMVIRFSSCDCNLPCNILTCAFLARLIRNHGNQ